MKGFPKNVPIGLPLALALAIACGGGQEAGETSTAGEAGGSASAVADGDGQGTAVAASAPGYNVVEVVDGGAIRGVVRHTGAVPQPRVVEVREDTEACGNTQEVQLVNVGSDKGLADVVASLTDIRQGAAVVTPDEPPALDQNGCRFAPHVVMVPVGVPLAVLNNDPITHNLHTLSFENRPVNKAQPSAVKKVGVTFRTAEKVKLNCDMHEWMSAWIVVMGHPYHAKTGPDGVFRIENVPTGTYTLEVWHESLGTQTRQVTVEAGETTDVAFELESQT